jgi:protein TonB
MTPTTKDQENAAAPTATGAPTVAKPLAEAPARPQPVALEVPVTVNGARTVDGSDKREPFSEKSATVLVFGHGAVIRVSTTLAPGQLVFLTNEKSKKEVVCQVVKSKSDGGAVGYVELRFTEPAPGFWGMRFPADTVLPQAAPRPVAPAPPVAAKPTVPVLPAPAPVVPAARPVTEAKLPEPPVRKEPETVAAPPLAVVSPAALPVVASKPATLSEPSPAPSSSVPSTEELKQQAARLQEQLSSLLFTGTPKSADSAAAPSATRETASAPEAAQNVSTIANLAPEPFKPIKVAAPSPKPSSASMADEEIKIPAWLAPLARENDSASASAAASSNSLSDSVSAIPETLSEEVLSEAPESSRRPEAAVFGGQLLGETSEPTEEPATGSKKGLFIGIAATLLLVAGAVWYSRQPGNAISGLIGGGSTPAQHATSVPAAAPSHSVSEPEQPAATTTAPSPAPPEAPARVNNPPASSTPATSLPTTTVARNSSPVPTPAAHTTLPAIEEPKKPSLGDVRLATPKINRGGSASTSGDAAPALLDVSPATGSSAPVSALGASHKSEPVAPVPVGGDVKPAKLLKSVPPVYPEIARSQHLSGNVQIDALIDADGNVSSMKVLSGPTLLHQSALSALKQWKYQPAELDGKPTAMHLTVTIQFRVQ